MKAVFLSDVQLPGAVDLTALRTKAAGPITDRRGRTLVLDKPIRGRECGDCSLCCKTQRIDALDKPSGQWCEHARPGKGGCAIYAGRPHECVTFRCSWLAGYLPDELKPTKVRAVIGASATSGGQAAVVYVDPGLPSAVDRDPLRAWIDGVADYMPVIITCGTKRTLVYHGSKEINVRDPHTGDVWLTSDQPTAKVEPGL